jgi:hypothetical protein
MAKPKRAQAQSGRPLLRGHQAAAPFSVWSKEAHRLIATASDAGMPSITGNMLE